MLGITLGGRYQIIRHLGGGGFGLTYLAEDLHLPGKPLCVVKQLKPRTTDSMGLQEARRLFDTEAEVLYLLGDHDQIPRLFAHFEEEQQFYLVQEFIEGHTLSKEISANQRFSEVQVADVLQDILTTLEFVHQSQVIHRDIKPSNLIRRKSDQKIVLIDFGAVKQVGSQVVDCEGQQLSITVAVGSLGYMPNEQLAGEPCLSSDIYAVGMLGIQMLTGIEPKKKRKDLKTSEIVWRDQAKISSEFADILDMMVRYDFRQRYQSATEALAALKELLPEPQHDVVALPNLRLTALDNHLIWFERGDELFQQQRYEAAIACYDKVIQIQPEDYLAWFKRGIALENLQRYEDAVMSYDKVIQIQPEDYLAWFKRGKVLEDLGRYEEALVSYDTVIRIQPDNYWAWHDRGQVLKALQRDEEAIESYDRAVQLKPDFKLAVEHRKQVLSQLKRVDQLYQLQHYDEAIASCEHAIQTNPNDALAWLMRGMALENLQHYTSAASSYDKVVQIQPDDHLAWFKRGGVLVNLQRYEEAVASYEQVVRIQPDNCWAWHDRGQALECLQQLEEAMTSYHKALELKPDFQAALEGRQRVLSQLKRSDTTSEQHLIQSQPYLERVY